MNTYQTYQEACDFCMSADVSNECVKYNPETNLYIVELDDNGKVVE